MYIPRVLEVNGWWGPRQTSQCIIGGAGKGRSKGGREGLPEEKDRFPFQFIILVTKGVVAAVGNIVVYHMNRITDPECASSPKSGGRTELRWQRQSGEGLFPQGSF